VVNKRQQLSPLKGMNQAGKMLADFLRNMTRCQAILSAF
jgi:hypothetical protein